MTDKIAIIGGGVAGLTAGYLLHDKYDVRLFEKDNRLGGNVYTLDTKTGEEIDISVFFYSPLEYPNFFKLLKKLGIKSSTRPMEGLSQSFRNLKTNRDYYLNCDPMKVTSTLHPKNLRAVFYQGIVFWNYYKGRKMNQAGKFDGLTLRQALEFLPGLKDDILKMAIFPICIMTSMLWEELMEAPAEFVFHKIEKQCGSVRKFISWRLYPCKTRVYVEKLAAPYRDKIKLNSNIQSVIRNDNAVVIKMEDGSEQRFDKVIFACPADTALNLLEKPTEDEDRLLGAWKYKDGLVMVHTDKSSYPSEDSWGLYSYLYTDEDGKINTSINAHYRFQNGVPNDSAYVGIQHPNVDIDKNLIEFRKVFRTPIYDKNSTKTIKELPSLNGKLGTYFCGSHCGYGLHEDAVTSAIDVCKMLGASWE